VGGKILSALGEINQDNEEWGGRGQPLPKTATRDPRSAEEKIPDKEKPHYHGKEEKKKRDKKNKGVGVLQPAIKKKGRGGWILHLTEKDDQTQGFMKGKRRRRGGNVVR